MLGLFWAFELLGSCSVVARFYSASPFRSISSLVMFSVDAYVSTCVGEVGAITSVAKQTVVALSVYAADEVASLRVATRTPVDASVAVAVAYSPATSP